MNDIEAVAASLRAVKFPVGSEQYLSTIIGQGRWSLSVSVAVSPTNNRYAHFTWTPEGGWTRKGTPVDLQTAVRVWWQHQTGLDVGAEEREIG